MIAHDYPPNAKDTPFDTHATKQYFIEGAGYTYLGDYKEFAQMTPFDERNKYIKGSFVISILKRFSMVEHGKKIWENPVVNDGVKEEEKKGLQFVIMCEHLIPHTIRGIGMREAESYGLYEDGTPLLKKFSVQKEAEAYGMKQSKIVQGKFLICQLINTVDRH